MIDVRIVAAALVFYFGVNTAVSLWKARPSASYTISEGKALHCELIAAQKN